MSIAKKIENWQKVGLLSQEQANKLIEFETKNTKPYLMYGLILLSAFFIGGGIISLIASNWDAVPAFVKIIGDFSLLGACGYGVYYTYCNEKNKYFEFFLFLFGLICLATIGLIAQIYQLQPDGSKAFLLWSSLMLPLIFFSKKMTFPIVVLSILNVSFFDEIFSHFDYVIKNFKNIILIFVLFIYTICYQLLTMYFPKVAKASVKSLKILIIIGFVMAILSSEYVFIFKDLRGTYLFLALLLFLITGFSFYLSYIAKSGYFVNYMMFLVFVTCFVQLGVFTTFLALLGLGYYAYIHKMPRLLNLTIFLFALRTFSFVQLYLSLMAGGIGLIVSGVVLLLLIWAWKHIFNCLNRRLKNEK